MCINTLLIKKINLFNTKIMNGNEITKEIISKHPYNTNILHKDTKKSIFKCNHKTFNYYHSKYHIYCFLKYLYMDECSGFQNNNIFSYQQKLMKKFIHFFDLGSTQQYELYFKLVDLLNNVNFFNCFMVEEYKDVESFGIETIEEKTNKVLLQYDPSDIKEFDIDVIKDNLNKDNGTENSRVEILDNIFPYLLNITLKHDKEQNKYNTIQMLDLLSISNILIFLQECLQIKDRPFITIRTLEILQLIFHPDYHPINDQFDENSMEIIFLLALHPESCTNQVILTENQYFRILHISLGTIYNILINLRNFVQLFLEKLESFLEIFIRETTPQDIKNFVLALVIMVQKLGLGYPIEYLFGFYSNHTFFNDHPIHYVLKGYNRCIHDAETEFQIIFTNHFIESGLCIILLENIEKYDLEVYDDIMKISSKVLQYSNSNALNEFISNFPWNKIPQLFLEKDDVNDKYFRHMMNVFFQLCNHHCERVAGLFSEGCFQNLFELFFTGQFQKKKDIFEVLSMYFEYFEDDDPQKIDILVNSPMLHVVKDLADDSDLDLLNSIVSFIITVYEENTDPSLGEVVNSLFLDSDFIDTVDELNGSDKPDHRYTGNAFFKLFVGEEE